jgi:hypothetical protein
VLDFSLVCLYPPLVKSHFKSLSLFFDLLNLTVLPNFTAQFFEALLDGIKDLVHLNLLGAALSEHWLHLFNSGVERFSARHFFQHLEKTFLALGDQGLYLTLLDNLELWLTLKREATCFKQIKQLLFLNRNAIYLVRVTVNLNIISFLHLEFATLNSYTLIWVI